jgi:hypothetical protein
MLIERTFEVGGAMTLASGGLFLAYLVESGILFAYPGFLVAGAGLVGFGAFFVWVGRQARQERLALLALGSGEGRPQGTTEREPP